MSADPLNVSVAVTLVSGVASQAIARRVRVPAIVPLLTLGIVLGTAGLVQPAAFGDGLRVLVGFAVAIVLFEGGLTLKTEAFRLAGRPIRNLVIYGAFVTWAGSAVAAYLLIPGISGGIAILFGSIVIVTGPTVILPILHAVRPRKRVADVLRGEAILIDPVGALYAVLVLEYLLATDGETGMGVIGLLGVRVFLGTVIGGVGALVLYWLLRRQESSPAADLGNLTVLSGAVGLYALSEAWMPESGALTVTLAGFLLGRLKPHNLEEIEEFKGHVTTLMVSIVFILLAAQLSLQDVVALGWRGALLVAVLIVVVRPATVFVSTWRTDLQLREKLFLSWIAPRGIVAAAVASLFALSLERSGFEGQGDSLIALVFVTIIGTVLLQGMTAGLAGRVLRVLAEDPPGFLIVGASRPAVALGRLLHQKSIPVLLVDTNPVLVRTAREREVPARRVNVLDEVAMEQVDTSELGYLLAMTSSDSANRVAARMHAGEFGAEHARAVRLHDSSSPPVLPGSSSSDSSKQAPTWLFDERLTLEEMDTLIRRGGGLREADVDVRASMAELAEVIGDAVPLLALGKAGRPRFLRDDDEVQEGETLVYLSRSADA